MDHDRFLTAVEQAAGVDRERAELATRATLQTLAERIAAGEARDLAAQLPPELAPWIGTTTAAEGFDVDEFLRRVAEREGVDVATAERHARAVLGALGQAVSPREFDDLVAELPKGFAALLPRGPYVELVPADEFLRRVAERAGLDAEGARRATDAVLQTLAERIAGGEVDDLIVHLPVALHPPLKRGRESTGGQATRMSLEDFIGRVAEREGVSVAQARDHARAVLVTLREAVGDEEFLDVTVQLPREYETVTALP
ncbi:MAG: hypothetical protein QOJ82_3106 [Solirubrobacteraceae bacterium]|jgi:uncharacterized protein (DUF2267 family)|nr:hypothetical protein [Solirubrobacteraceae bacterium]